MTTYVLSFYCHCCVGRVGDISYLQRLVQKVPIELDKKAPLAILALSSGVYCKSTPAQAVLYVSLLLTLCPSLSLLGWVFFSTITMQDGLPRLAVVYNHFKSAVSYDTLTVNVLTEQQAAASSKKELNNYEFEPERSDMWKDLQDFYYACVVYGCMLDNIASEQMTDQMYATTREDKSISPPWYRLVLRCDRAEKSKRSRFTPKASYLVADLRKKGSGFTPNPLVNPPEGDTLFSLRP